VARKKQKLTSEPEESSIRFGSMPFDVPQTILSFSDPEFAGLLADGRLVSLAASVKAHAADVFAHERVQLTRARAREIVLAFFRGERYQDQDAKELVLAAAGYVKADELVQAIDSGASATWADAHTAFELALWICASGVHTQVDVLRGTRAATRARQSAQRERVEQLAAALKADLVKADPVAVLRWRGEKNTPANYERARRDLRRAQSTLPAATRARR
jgi:hypothetical protein